MFFYLSSEEKHIQMDNELICVALGFERISRILTVAFYTVGISEIIASTSAIALHSLNVQEELALFLESLAAVLAAVLVLVPLDATRKACHQAFSLATSYKGRPRELSQVNYKRLVSTGTLCFQHPMSKCPMLSKRWEQKTPADGV